MEIKPGFLDGLTRVDELLIENTRTLRELRTLLEREEDRETKVVSFTYPDTGDALATLQAGTTVLDFSNGTVNSNGVVSRMGRSLQSEGVHWLRSFFVQSDKQMIIVTEDGSRVIATEERDGEGSQQQFKKLTLITTEETDVFVIVCTSPQSVLHVVGNVAVLSDPKDIFGNRTYIGGAELAARLGSIDMFERRGNVIYIDDFEDSTLKWDTAGLTSGTGSSACRSITQAKSGSYSVKLVTGSTGYFEAGIRQSFWIPPITTKIGIESLIFIPNTSNYMDFRVIYYTGTKYYSWRIRIDKTNSKLRYEDSALNMQDIGVLPTTSQSYNMFYPIKFVCNPSDIKYDRVYFGKNVYNLSEISAYSTNSILAPGIVIEIYAIGASAVNHVWYLDNFILTHNEPSR